LGSSFDDLARIRDAALHKGKIPVGWQLSIETLSQLSEQHSPDPRDRWVDQQPLTLLGLPYELDPTSSGDPILLVKSSE